MIFLSTLSTHNYIFMFLYVTRILKIIITCLHHIGLPQQVHSLYPAKNLISWIVKLFLYPMRFCNFSATPFLKVLSLWHIRLLFYIKKTKHLPRKCSNVVTLKHSNVQPFLNFLLFIHD